MTLVILAAGMASRFGGLKQIESVDNNNSFIIDYSIYDAIKAGFDKIVFVIKRENDEIFKKTIGNRISDLVKVEYAYQENDNLKEYVGDYKDRIKPFGTAHALYCAKDYIDGAFGVISADDFYGHGSFVKLYEALKNKKNCTIGYKIKNTMSENGSVKRGICFTLDNYLIENNDYIVERKNDKILAKSLVDSKTIEIDEDQNVSMLMYGLDYSIIEYIENNLKTFFNQNKDNLDTCEYLIPMVLTDMIKDNKIKVELIPTEEKWMGVTYKDDLPKLKNHLKQLVSEGVYPEKLYNQKD